MMSLMRAFERPLRIGDRDQVEVMQIMNGEELYCNRCFQVFNRDNHRIQPGQPHRCGGRIVRAVRCQVRS